MVNERNQNRQKDDILARRPWTYAVSSGDAGTVRARRALH